MPKILVEAPLPPCAPKAQRRTLAGAMRRSVRGEDLLGKRRAGARHADDEHGRGIGVGCSRPAREAFRREGGDGGVVIGFGRLARKRLGPPQQGVALAPLRESLVVRALARPEFGEVVARHDLVFEHRDRPHLVERILHRLGAGARVGAPVLAKRQQHVAPQPQRLEFWRGGAERVELGQRGPRLVRPAEGDERQRPLQPPVARGREIVGGRSYFVEQRLRLGGFFLLQLFGDEIEPRAGVVRIARQRLAQQRFRRLVAAGEARERGEIAGRRGMSGLRLKGAGHGPPGFVNRPLRITGEAIIDPGVGEARPQLCGDGESLFGALRLAVCHPRLAIGVMRLGHIGRRKARVARRLQGGAGLAALQGR